MLKANSAWDHARAWLQLYQLQLFTMSHAEVEALKLCFLYLMNLSRKIISEDFSIKVLWLLKTQYAFYLTDLGVERASQICTLSRYLKRFGRQSFLWTHVMYQQQAASCAYNRTNQIIKKCVFFSWLYITLHPGFMTIRNRKISISWPI